MSNPVMNEPWSQTSAAPSALYNLDPKDYEIHWIVDYGTKTLCIAAQVVRKGANPHPARTRILELQTRGKGEIQQICGYVRKENHADFHDKDFMWGDELLEVLNNDRISYSEDRVCVCERLKMVLYPGERTQDAISAIEQSLAKTGFKQFSPHKLIEEHLRHIRRAAMRATVAKFRSTSFTEDEILAMNVHTFFTVPEISTEATVHTLQQLLISAGFQRTVALTETEAAGAWRSYQLLSENYELPFRFQGDDELLVADAGGLTLNVASYKCEGFVEYGAQMRVIPTGNKEGSACGAEMITFEFFKFIREYCESHYGGFEACRTRLGYSSEAFYRELARKFESYKVNFLDEGERMIKVDARMSSERDRSEIRFEVTREMITGWFCKAFEEIVKIIDAVKSERTKVITLTGGFFRSFFLVKRLKERYEPAGIYMPGIAQDGNGKSDPSVVLGGMARSVLMEPRAPYNFCMGIAEAEPYSSKIHPGIKRDSRLVKRCRYTGGRFVEERWRTLLAPGDLANCNGTFVAEDIWQEYLLTMKEATLHKQVLVTHDPIQDHDPVEVEVDGVWQLRPGIYEWGREIECKIDPQVLSQYRKMWPKTGRKVAERARYLVWARLKVHRDGPSGMDVALSWEVAPPSFRVHTNDDGEFRPPANGITAIGSSILHDANHSSFIQRNGNVAPSETNKDSVTDSAGQRILGDQTSSAEGEAQRSSPLGRPPSKAKRKTGKGPPRLTLRATRRKRPRLDNDCES